MGVQDYHVDCTDLELDILVETSDMILIEPGEKRGRMEMGKEAMDQVQSQISEPGYHLHGRPHVAYHDEPPFLFHKPP